MPADAAARPRVLPSGCAFSQSWGCVVRASVVTNKIITALIIIVLLGIIGLIIYLALA